MTLFLIEFETRNFNFKAVGTSNEDARNVLRKGWAEHCKHTSATLEYLEENIDSANVTELRAGSCLRDGVELLGKV